jgi:DNA-binding response OmpR family regulator
MAKILLVEDRADEAAVLVRLLESDKHVVDTVTSSEDALHLLKTYSYDLLIVDWELPGLSGAELCKTYREDGGKAAVLMLTGRQDTLSKAAGLDFGADDYLCKPYDYIELGARIRSLLRRPAGLIASELSAPGITYQVETKTVKAGTAVIELSQREAALLEYLLRHPNRTFSAKALLDAVWPLESALSEDTVRSCMRHLRQKLLDACGSPVIATVRRSGYIIRSGAENNR